MRRPDVDVSGRRRHGWGRAVGYHPMLARVHSTRSFRRRDQVGGLPWEGTLF